MFERFKQARREGKQQRTYWEKGIDLR